MNKVDELEESGGYVVFGKEELVFGLKIILIILALFTIDWKFQIITPKTLAFSFLLLMFYVAIWSKLYDSFQIASETLSVLGDFLIVLITFFTVWLLKKEGYLNIENTLFFIVTIFTFAAFWGSHNKDKIPEILEFKEPKIGEK